MEKFNYFSNKITQNIGIFIIIFSGIAYMLPKYFSRMTNYTTIFLAIAMFGMGTGISYDSFREIFKKPKDVLVGCLAQYTIMPLIAWILALLFKQNRDIALGIILVGSCPGGTASNVITHIAKGDVSMSVTMTIFSTLLAPIVTPLLVYLLAGRWVEVSLLAMFKSVVTVVLIPVLLGIFARKILPETVEKSSSIFPLISSTAIILIISGIIASNKEKIIESGAVVLIIVIIHNLLGLLGGLFLGKIFDMPYDKKTAIAIEVGMQNSGLAIQLASVNFAQNPLATLPGAIFSIWHNIAGTIFAGIRRRNRTAG